jgi:hypothetical protein
MREPHKVTLVIEDDLVIVRLVCPVGGCEPAQQCSECGQLLGASERCYACPSPDDECWVKSWFDNLDALYMHVGECDLTGRTLPVPIECEWDGESLMWHVVEGSSA